MDVRHEMVTQGISQLTRLYVLLWDRYHHGSGGSLVHPIQFTTGDLVK